MEMVMIIDMFMQKLQLSFLYVTEYLQKCVLMIQLIKQQKATIEKPPQKLKSFFKTRATPPWSRPLGFAETICDT